MTRETDKVTCGGCHRSWDNAKDPAPSALCHWCHGRGYSNAQLFNERERAAILFFFVHAGYSYNPKTEKSRRARYNNAKALTDAEQRLILSGRLTAQWEIDPDVLSSDWTDADDDYLHGYSRPWATWQVCLYDERSNSVVASLGGIDFGRDGHPDTDPYARVCVAELALAHVADCDNEDDEPDEPDEPGQHWIVRVQDALNDYREVQSGYFDGSQADAAAHFRSQSPWRKYFGQMRYQITMRANSIVLQHPVTDSGSY